jgi:hypothetical protein
MDRGDTVRKLLLALLILLVASPSFAGGGATMMMIGGGASVAGGTALFSDGFETNDFSLWTAEVDAGGDLSVSTDYAYAGTYSMKCVNNDTNDFYVRKTLDTALTDAWIHFYILWNETSSASAGSGGEYYVFRGTATNTSNWTDFDFKMNTASPPAIALIRTHVWNSGDTSTGSLSSTMSTLPSAATWYEVKAHFNAGTFSSDGTVELWFNGEKIIDVTGIDYNDAWDIKQVQNGIPSNNDIGGTGWTSMIQYIDNFEVAESDIW